MLVSVIRFRDDRSGRPVYYAGRSAETISGSTTAPMSSQSFHTRGVEREKLVVTNRREDAKVILGETSLVGTIKTIIEFMKDGYFPQGGFTVELSADGKPEEVYDKKKYRGFVDLINATDRKERVE